MTQKQSLEQIFTDPRAKAYFTSLCGSEQAGQAFVQQLARVCQQDPRLQFAEPQEVFNAAVTAAELDLPLHTVFKTAYIIPTYHEKVGKWRAQFVIGYKGLRLLAQRTGEFKRIVALPVYEGQIIKIDPVKGSKFNFAYAGSDKIVGFYAYLETHNGFRDEKFWTDEQMRRHAAKYSQDYHDENSIWHTHYVGMGKKALLKALLNESAPLYQQVQTAIVADHSVNDTPVEAVLNGETDGGFLSAVQVSYPDNPADTSTPEPTPAPEPQEQPPADKMVADDELMQTVLANVRQGLLTTEQALAHYALTGEQQALLAAAAEQPPESAKSAEPEAPTPAAEPRDDKAVAAPVVAEQSDLLDDILSGQRDGANTPSETAGVAGTPSEPAPAPTPEQAQPAAAPVENGAQESSVEKKAAPKRKRKPAPTKTPQQQDTAAVVAEQTSTTDAEQKNQVSDETPAQASPPVAPVASQKAAPKKLSAAPLQDEDDADDPISAAIGGMIAKWTQTADTSNNETAGDTAQEAAAPADSTPPSHAKDHTWQRVGDESATGWSAVIGGAKVQT